MWVVAMQMSMDPSLHSMKQVGNASHFYGPNKIEARTKTQGAILGGAIGSDKKPPKIVQRSDGTFKLRSGGLGV